MRAGAAALAGTVARPLARSLGRRPRSLGDVAALALAAAATALFLARGVAYPLAAGDPEDSWGGPTLAGAWAVHLLVAAAALAAVAALLARRDRRVDRRHGTDARPSP